jgi:hypothetical protein
VHFDDEFINHTFIAVFPVFSRSPAAQQYLPPALKAVAATQLSNGTVIAIADRE